MRTFPSYPGCPVCGDRDHNPITLAMRWGWDDERGLVTGTFTPGREHMGYENRLHGGILSALLDECLAWACAVETSRYCVTGELTVRYKSPAALGEPVVITGVAGAAWGPYVKATGEARTSSGDVLATASAVFSVLTLEESMKLHDALLFAPEDWDVLSLPPSE
jgi:acyl-coenzyme A thioesterase PaaI-like protein